MSYHPSEQIMRAKILCLLTAPSLSDIVLAWNARGRLFLTERTNAMKDPLEPLHLKRTSRCASRGEIPLYVIKKWEPGTQFRLSLRFGE